MDLLCWDLDVSWTELSRDSGGVEEALRREHWSLLDIIQFVQSPSNSNILKIQNSVDTLFDLFGQLDTLYAKYPNLHHLWSPKMLLKTWLCPMTALLPEMPTFGHWLSQPHGYPTESGLCLEFSKNGFLSITKRWTALRITIFVRKMTYYLHFPSVVYKQSCSRKELAD